jgi:hypothetical protein
VLTQRIAFQTLSQMNAETVISIFTSLAALATSLVTLVREERKTKLAHVFLSERAVLLPAAPALQAGVQGRESGDPE